MLQLPKSILWWYGTLWYNFKEIHSLTVKLLSKHQESDGFFYPFCLKLLNGSSHNPKIQSKVSFCGTAPCGIISHGMWYNCKSQTLNILGTPFKLDKALNLDCGQTRIEWPLFGPRNNPKNQSQPSFREIASCSTTSKRSIHFHSSYYLFIRRMQFT